MSFSNKEPTWIGLETKAVVCPTCGAGIGQRCHTSTNRPANEPHRTRYEAAATLPMPRYRQPRVRSEKPRTPWYEVQAVEEDGERLLRVEFDSMAQPSIDVLRIAAKRAAVRDFGSGVSSRPLTERTDYDYATGLPCAFYWAVEARSEARRDHEPAA